MNDLVQFQPAFSGVNTLLAVSTNIETEQITNGNLKLKGGEQLLLDNIGSLLFISWAISMKLSGYSCPSADVSSFVEKYQKIK
jgi:hypothetical protein